MSKLILRTQFGVAGGEVLGTGTYTPAMPTCAVMLVQVTGGGTVTLQGTNLRDDPGSWQAIGTATGASTQLTTLYAFIRATCDAAGVVAISSADSSGASGSSGGATAPVTVTNRSGTTSAVAGTATTVMAANASRRGCSIQAPQGADIWVSEVGSATLAPPSVFVPAGALYEWPAHGVPGSAISVACALASQAYAAREW